MKKLLFVSISIILSFLLVGCGDGQNTGKPNSGVVPVNIERDPQGHLLKDTEKLPMTGQWCHELDPNLQRIGSPSNCIADY